MGDRVLLCVIEEFAIDDDITKLLVDTTEKNGISNRELRLQLFLSLHPNNPSICVESAFKVINFGIEPWHAVVCLFSVSNAV